jgi:hypothetical protein
MIDRLLPGVPAPAAILGLAGLIPFAAAAALGLQPGPTGERAGVALLAYGAVILSFLGGIHWGLALTRPAGPDWRGLGIGVLPSLAGWAGLLAGGTAGLLLILAGFLALLPVDLALARSRTAPPWFARLRTVLTGAVAACLLLAILG